MKSLCVMPVYNQVTQFPKVLESCRAHLSTDELLIVDNGSTDGSSDLIAASGYRCIRQEVNSGIGSALRLGARIALDEGYDICCNMAGNGKMKPSELAAVRAPIEDGHADYVTGSRYLEGGESPNLPAFRKYAIPLVVNNVVRLFMGRRITDATCGLRAYRTTLLQDERIAWDRDGLDRYQFEYFLYAKAIKLGYRIAEVPCSMIYPPRGQSYSHIPPLVGWWQMLEPWFFVSLGISYGK